MILDVKGIAILVIILLGGLFYWRVSAKLDKADRLEAENNAMRERIATLEGRAEVYDLALLAKAERERWGREVQAAIKYQLEQVKDHDETAAAELGGVIPDSVRSAWLRGEEGGSADHSGATGSDAH